jgi:hypothetical protein
MKRYGIFSILLSLYTSTLLASTDLVEELRPDSRIQKHVSYDDDIQCVIDGVQAIRNAAPCSSELIDWFKEHSENQKYIISVIKEAFERTRHCDIYNYLLGYAIKGQCAEVIADCLWPGFLEARKHSTSESLALDTSISDLLLASLLKCIEDGNPVIFKFLFQERINLLKSSPYSIFIADSVRFVETCSIIKCKLEDLKSYSEESEQHHSYKEMKSILDSLSSRINIKN